MENSSEFQYVSEIWDKELISVLSKYITLPCKSPKFDPNWKNNGFMYGAIDLVCSWVHKQKIPGMNVECLHAENRTPLLLIDIPGSGSKQDDDYILIYGHLDKQPEFDGWADDLEPWKPVLRDGKLYGRGAADDGYAVFCALTAINLAVRDGRAYSPVRVILECCEESGSFDLPTYMDIIDQRYGSPDLVICLDSSAGNYDQLWVTNSLRGIIIANVSVTLLEEGVHSGIAGGIAASSFRILRGLLDRIEDPLSGEILISELNTEIAAHHRAEAEKVADILGDEIHQGIPFLPGVLPINASNTELILNNTLRPCVEVTGQQGLPDIVDAGYTIRPSIKVQLAFRVPPGVDVKQAIAAIRKQLAEQVPNNAKVSFELYSAEDGWASGKMPQWLDACLNTASNKYFGKDAVSYGMGGTIPFIDIIAKKYPDAHCLVTGVLGPHSNAHGPNEFLHIPTVKKLTCCVAEVICEHYQAKNR